MSSFVQIFPPIVVAAGLTDEVVVHTPVNGVAEYWGTRAAIEAEGIVPDSVQWPTEYNSVKWKSGLLQFSLVRRRPEGVKGSRRELSTVDWWCLRWEYEIYEHSKLLSQRRRVKELKRQLYLCTDEGQQEDWRRWNLLTRAREDERFCAFLNGIPAIAGLKRNSRRRGML